MTLNESLNENRMNSFEKFEQRLKTFKIFKWFAKPAEFSPIECAKHGWINLTKDTLKCVACSNLFYYYTKAPNSFRVHLNSNDKTEIQYPKLLIDKHNVNCPWRSMSISNSLIEIDIFNEEKAYEKFLLLKETFQKCQQFPYLVSSTYEKFSTPNDLIDNLNNSPGRNINLNIHLKEKMKNVNILAACGWSYKDDKDVLNCSKCYRSAGLWMYKRSQPVDESEEEEESMQNDQELEDDHNISNISDVFTFHSTDPYSDESAIKSCISNIINIIEIEEQASLKSTYSDEIRNKFQNYSNKKRKIDQINDSFTTKTPVEVSETNKKVFDPIQEHFSWCPWVSKTGSQKLVCGINFDTVIKFLLKKNQNIKQTDPSCINVPDMNTYLLRCKSTNDDVVVNSQLLLDKVKAAQSILINCTSQYSFKC